MPYFIKQGNTVFREGDTVFSYDQKFGGTVTELTGVSVTGHAVNDSRDMLGLSNSLRLLFVSNFSANTISVYQLDSIMLPPNVLTGFNKPSAFYVDETSDRLFVCNQGNNTVSVLKLSTLVLQFVITQSQGAFNKPVSISGDPISNRILVANNGNSTLSELNYTTPATRTSVISTETLLISVLFDRGGLRLLSVTNDNLLNVMDFSTYSIQNTYAARYKTGGLALLPGKNKICYICYTDSGYYNYGSPNTFTLMQTVTSNGCGIAADTVNNRIFCLSDAGKLYIIVP